MKKVDFSQEVTDFFLSLEQEVINTETSTPNVVVILGNSRTGKDTIADYLNVEYDYNVHHVLDNYYSFLENYFGIGLSIRQSPEAKKVVIPGKGNVTLSDMLIGLYHWTNEQGINWTEKDFCNVTSQVLDNTVFTGVRNMHEAEPVIFNSYDYQNDKIRYFVHTFLVTRPGADGFTSDNKLQQIADYFENESDSFTTINNQGTLEELYVTIDELMSKLGIR